MSQIDLRPAAERMIAVLSGIPDDALGHPTPCAGYSVLELVEHVGGFAVAFTAARRRRTSAS